MRAYIFGNAIDHLAKRIISFDMITSIKFKVNISAGSYCRLFFTVFYVFIIYLYYLFFLKLSIRSYFPIHHLCFPKLVSHFCCHFKS